MFKAISQFASKFSIKFQMTAIAIPSLLVIALLGIFAYNYEFQTEASSQSNISFSETASQLQGLSKANMKIQHHEKKYFAHSDSKQIKLYSTQIDASIKYIDQLTISNPEIIADLLLIKQNILEHKKHFFLATQMQSALGSTADLGLEGELRTAVHNVENLLNSYKQQSADSHQLNAALVEMLMLRRHEKDFMLREGPEYLAKFKRQLRSFKSTIKQSNLKDHDKQQIAPYIIIYDIKFRAWSLARISLTNERNLLNKFYAQFSPRINQLIQKLESSRNISHIQLISSQQLSKTFLIISISIIVALLIGISVMFLFFHQHEKFKNIVKQKATLMKQAHELKQMNVQNRNLANMDTLTSLPNRRSFFSQLEAFTKRHKGNSNKKLVVALLDLDGFKRVNDVFGHPVGDDLLIKVSQRLKKIVGEDIILARLGGDEFGLIITNPKEIKNILQIGQNICDAMRQVFQLKEGSIQIGATIGFVEHPSMAPTSQLLFERADYALCYSKQHSKGQPVIFSDEHETIIRNLSNIEHQLREADLEEQLSVVFQPIIDTQTQKVMGFEALARWNNPALGNVKPDIFIRAAEQMGIIGRLTTLLLHKALSATSQWPDDVYMSFNLSIYDLSSPQTILSLINIIEKSNFPSNRIVFEITETAVMHDFKQANEALKLLKLQGAQIALDDFGTGYSSLSYVQRMPLDRLKVDRSFIIDIANDKHTRNIVRTILDLCNNLNLYCIIEGVETKQQLTVLEEMGCRYIQGYYFSRPLNQQNVLKFIAQQNNSTIKLHA